MEIDRRRALIGGACTALALAAGGPVSSLKTLAGGTPGHRSMASVDPVSPGARPQRQPKDRSAGENCGRTCHPVGRRRVRPDRSSGYKMDGYRGGRARPPQPARVEALLDIGTATFWRGAEPHGSDDAEAFDHAFAVRMLADEIVGAEQCDRMLMAPKLRPKAQAVSAKASDLELFRVRAISAQIRLARNVAGVRRGAGPSLTSSCS
jgi:hypothetical protein